MSSTEVRVGDAWLSRHRPMLLTRCEADDGCRHPAVATVIVTVVGLSSALSAELCGEHAGRVIDTLPQPAR
jgi:hypothetical protein